MSAMPSTAQKRRDAISLVAQYKNARQAVRSFHGPLVVVGRSPKCELVLGSDSVAPVHAAIVFSPAGCFLSDLGGPRGTLVNGRPVRTHRLSNDDELTFGNFRFRVQGLISEGVDENLAPRFALVAPAPIGRVQSQDPLLVVGSDLGADVVLRDQRIAGVQALVAWTDEGVLVRDVAGGVGVAVNGKPSRIEPLHVGDIVVIGPHDLRVEGEGLPARMPESVEPEASPSAPRVALTEPRMSVSEPVAAAPFAPVLDRSDAPVVPATMAPPQSPTPVAPSLAPAAVLPARFAAIEPPAFDAGRPPIDASAARPPDPGAPLTLVPPADEHWPETLSETDDLELDIELSRDIDDLDEARRQVAAAKDEFDRERTGGNESAVLSADFLTDMAVPAVRNDAAAGLRPGPSAAELSAERHALEAERAMLAAERSNLEGLRNQLEAQRRDLTGARVQLDAARSELNARLGELDSRTREAESLRMEHESRRSELERLRAENEERAREVAVIRERIRLEQAELTAQRAALSNESALLKERRSEVDRIGQELANRENVSQELTAARQEIGRLTVELESVRHQGLADRTAVSKAMGTLEATRRERDGLKSKLRDDAKARQAEVDQARRDVEAQNKELERRTADVTRREQAVTARVEALRTRAAAEQKKLDDRSVEIRTAVEAQRERLKKERAEVEQLTAQMNQARARLQADVEAAHAERARDLDERARALDDRESTYKRLSDELRQHVTALREREAALERGRTELASRQKPLGEVEAALADQQSRLREWQSRVQTDDARLDRMRVELESAQRDLSEERERLAQLRAELSAKSSGLEPELARIETSRSSLQEREAQLDQLKVALAERDAQLAARQNELETFAERLARQEEQLDDVKARTEEAERREEAVARSEAGLVTRMAQVEFREVEQRQLRERLERRTAEFDERETVLRDREQRADALRRTAESDKQSADAARDEARRLRDDATAQVAAAAEANEANARRAADQERQAGELRAEQERISRLAETSQREHLELSLAQDTLRSEQAELARQRDELSQRTAALGQERDELTRRAAALNDEQATLEQSRDALRTEQRRVATQSDELAARSAEQARRTAAGAEKERELRQLQEHLERERVRLRGREDELSERALELDTRSAEQEQSQHDLERRGVQLDRERELILTERAQLADSQRQHDSERRDLEQTRLTYAAGLTQLEARERAIADREREAAEKSLRTAALQTRLEEELDRVSKQRVELVSGQAAGPAEQMRVLSAQLQTLQANLRRQEESLVAHERALHARTEQLAQFEQLLQARGREADDRAAALQRERDGLAAEREAMVRQLEAERQTVIELQSAAEHELRSARARSVEVESAVRAEIASRRDEIDRELESRRVVFEAELRDQVRKELTTRLGDELKREEQALLSLRERQAALEKELSARASQFDATMQQRRAEIESQEETRRAAFEQQIEARRRDLDATADDFRRRQAALQEEETLLETARRELEAQRAHMAHAQAALSDRESRAVAAERAADAAQRAASERAAEAHISDDESEREPVARRRAAPATRGWRRDAAADDAAESDVEARRDADSAAEESESRDAAVLAAEQAIEMHVATAGTVDLAAFEEAPADSPAPASAQRRALRAVGLMTAVAAAIATFYAVHVATVPPLASGRVPLAGISMPAEQLTDLVRTEPNLANLGGDAHADFVSAFRSGTLTVLPDDGGLRVEGAQRELVNALGTSIGKQLTLLAQQQATPGPDARQTLETQRDGLKRQLAEAEGKLATLEQAVGSDDWGERLAAAEKTRSDCKARMTAATKAEDAAAGAVAEAEAIDNRPMSVSAQQLAEALAADPPYFQAFQELQAQSGGFRDELVKALRTSKSATDHMERGWAELVLSLQRQQNDAHDEPIKRDLAALATTLADAGVEMAQSARESGELLSQAEDWSDQLDASLLSALHAKAVELLPLAESQAGRATERALDAVRKFASAGSEPAQRKVIESALSAPLSACQAARGEVSQAAGQFDAKNNFRLHAAAEQVRDLGRNVARRRSQIENVLKVELSRKSKAKRQQDLAELRKSLARARAEHQSATQALLSADEEIGLLKRGQENSSKRRDALIPQHAEIGRLKQSLAELEARIAGADSPGAASVAPIVYQPLPNRAIWRNPRTWVVPGAAALAAALIVGWLFYVLARGSDLAARGAARGASLAGAA